MAIQLGFQPGDFTLRTWRSVAAEFIATGLFVFLGTASVVAARAAFIETGLITKSPPVTFIVAVALALAMPVATLSAAVLAPMMRMTRSAILNVLSHPSIEMAILKGVPRRTIILKHALPNAFAPIINVIAINLAYLVVGVVIVEVVFVYPGLGQLLVDSVSKRDIPVVQASGMIFAATYILLNLTADVLSIMTNPRLMHPR
ncbi:MAG: ABC transporter permease [Proteobacteria bacterium]|nr:ABC transporter permease [Pseudomonadota bacterium]